jgi:alkylhydroperoxidase/carboxymuconolactone decarboxylase family protein YurZ
MVDQDALFRRLALGDTSDLEALVRERRAGPGSRRLHPRDEALVRIGALMASDGAPSTWQLTVRGALDAGLTTNEIVDAMIVLAPIVGASQVVSLAPKLALALGIDVDAMLEFERAAPGRPGDTPVSLDRVSPP